MRTSSTSRGGFALAGLKCAHLLVMAEDGEMDDVPADLRPRICAIENVMRSAMKVAVGGP